MEGHTLLHRHMHLYAHRPPHAAPPIQTYMHLPHTTRHLSMCINVCTYIHASPRHKYTHITYMYLCKYTQRCTPMPIHTHTPTCPHVAAHIYIYTHTCACPHMCTDAHPHAHLSFLEGKEEVTAMNTEQEQLAHAFCITPLLCCLSTESCDRQC